MEIYPQLMLIHNRSETNNQDRYTPPKIQLYEFSIFDIDVKLIVDTNKSSYD